MRSASWQKKKKKSLLTDVGLKPALCVSLKFNFVPLYASQQTSRSLSDSVLLSLSLGLSFPLSVKSHCLQQSEQKSHRCLFLPHDYCHPHIVSSRGVCATLEKRSCLCRYRLKLVLNSFRQSLFSLLIQMPKPIGFCHAFVDRSQS